jgi:two-component system alkaline phosphatase synthesis response regulator PhoP
MSHQSILIVDDDSAITNALSLLFEQAGYLVSTANSGEEALARLEPRPDLIVLDILLPDMDGYAVCRRIRETPDHPPIVMLTARDESRDKVLGLELGADLYLTKPFEPAELLAQVHALLRLIDERKQNPEDHPLACGPLRIWEGQHRVELGGAEVQLTPIEFQLLKHFIRQPGHVLGRETLLREVWGYDFDGDSRVVDVHVQRLRAKIENRPGQPQLLQTVRGFGYRLVDPGP